MFGDRARVGIIGVGMVGGTTARWFQEKTEHEVFLYDINKDVGTMEEMNKEAEYIFICVPTPYHKGKGYSTHAIRQALKKVDDGKTVVIKSTVLPGTTHKLQAEFPELVLLFNPEFLSEATCDDNFANPEVQIVGCVDERGYDEALAVVNLLPEGKYMHGVCPAQVAESIKFTRNLLSAAKVVVLNEAHDILERAGIAYDGDDEITVRKGLETIAKRGSLHLNVVHKGGRGAGGKCLKKELSAWTDFGKLTGRQSSIIEGLNEKNLELLRKYPKTE